VTEIVFSADVLRETE